MFATLIIQTRIQPDDRYQIKPSIIINTIRLYIIGKILIFTFYELKRNDQRKRHRTKEIKVVTILGI